jgi:serine/threonine-protein kinase
MAEAPASGTATGEGARAVHSPEDLAALAAAVRAGGPPARSAARTLAQAGERSIPALRASLAGSAGPARLRLLEALRAARPGGRVDEPGEWIPLLSDPDCDARRAAARVLGEAGDPAAVPALSALAAQREGRSRRASGGGDPRAGAVCGAVEAGEALERIRDAARPR